MNAIATKPICFACRREKKNWPDNPAEFLAGLGFRLGDPINRYWYRPLNRLRLEPLWEKVGEKTQPDGTVEPTYRLSPVDNDMAEYEDVAVLHELQRQAPTGRIVHMAPRHNDEEIEAERRRILGMPDGTWQNRGRRGPYKDGEVEKAEASAAERKRAYIREALDSMRSAQRITGEWCRCAACHQWPDRTPPSVIAEAEAKDREYLAEKAAKGK